uniref:Uncharacterized protein n=1 Tax=Arundo donax TaxID=35708 RepID=A0A0A9HPW0_ARUDO
MIELSIDCRLGVLDERGDLIKGLAQVADGGVEGFLGDRLCHGEGGCGGMWLCVWQW